MMSEYHCHPLWEAMSGGRKNLEARELPIPENLASRIEAWGDVFEGTYNAADPAASGFHSDAHKQGFIEQGALLLQELKAALGHGFEVEYRMLGGNRIKL